MLGGQASKQAQPQAQETEWRAFGPRTASPNVGENYVITEDFIRRLESTLNTFVENVSLHREAR